MWVRIVARTIRKNSLQLLSKYSYVTARRSIALVLHPFLFLPNHLQGSLPLCLLPSSSYSVPGAPFQHMPGGGAKHPNLVPTADPLANFLLNYTIKIGKIGVDKRQSGTTRGGQQPTPATPKSATALYSCNTLLSHTLYMYEIFRHIFSTLSILVNLNLLNRHNASILFSLLCF